MSKKDQDFDVCKFYMYNGPNYYLNSRALVFNIFLEPEGPEVSYYWDEVQSVFPSMKKKKPSTVIDLFANVVTEVLKMDIGLYINNFSVKEDGKYYVVAVECLDSYIAEEAVYLVSEWFKAMNDNHQYDVWGRFAELQSDFDKTMLGGPTLYSLVEAAVKKNIPVFFLKEENQFQWGYGCKQLRGRSTTFHTDSIKTPNLQCTRIWLGSFLKCVVSRLQKGKTAAP